MTAIAYSTGAIVGALANATGDDFVVVRIQDDGPDWINEAFPSLSPDAMEMLAMEGKVALRFAEMQVAQEAFNTLTRDAQAAWDRTGGGVHASIEYTGRMLRAPVITTTNVVGSPTMRHHLFKDGKLVS